MTTTQSPAAPTRTYADYSAPLWRRWLLTREMAVIALTVAVFVYATINVDNFDGPLTVKFLLQDIAPILLIALPMTLIIITGEIDLSVASIMGLSSVLLGVLHDSGMSIPVAAVLALLAGLACGALNGFLIAYVGLPSLAVTIGTLALFRGIAVGLLGTTAITDFTDRWSDLATNTIGESRIPLVMIPFAVLTIAFVVLLHFSTFGRGIYEIGLNDEAAHFTGVDVARTKFILFVLSGVVSAFAGIYFTLRYGSARGDNATGYELQVIAAVLLGGVSIFGGRGRLHGVLAGVVLIGVISSALRLESVTVNVTNIIVGLLLVASVILPSVLAWTSSRLPRKATTPPESSPTPNAASAGVQDNPKGRPTMKFHTRRPIALAAIILTASAALTACGSDDSDSGSDSGSDGGGELSMTMLPKNLGNPYFDTSTAGAEAAAEDLGAEMEEVGPETASPDAQVSYINTVAQQGKDALILSANDPEALCDAIDEARSADVKVITFDADTNPDCRDLFINQATAEGIAAKQLELISDQIGGKGEIAILSAAANATNQNAWIDMMEKELADNPDYADIELVDTVYGDDDDQKSFDQTEALLQNHPDLKGIISPTTVGIAAAARYLSDSSSKGKVALTGLGTPNQMREYVENGTVESFALWNPSDLGALATYAAAALANGDISGEEGDSFEAGDLGEFEVGADGVVLLGEPFTFNADNIGDFDF